MTMTAEEVLTLISADRVDNLPEPPPERIKVWVYDSDIDGYEEREIWRIDLKEWRASLPEGQVLLAPPDSPYAPGSVIAAKMPDPVQRAEALLIEAQKAVAAAKSAATEPILKHKAESAVALTAEQELDHQSQSAEDSSDDPEKALADCDSDELREIWTAANPGKRSPPRAGKTWFLNQLG